MLAYPNQIHISIEIEVFALIAPLRDVKLCDILLLGLGRLYALFYNPVRWWYWPRLLLCHFDLPYFDGF